MKKFARISVVLCIVLGLLVSGITFAAPAKKEITVWAFSWTAETLNKIKGMFEGSPAGKGISVKVVLQDWGGMQTKALAAIASGEEVPDVCTFSSAWVGPMMTSRGLAPLNKYMDKAFMDKFINGALGIYNYKKVQFGIPLDIDLAPIIYRKDIVDPALAKLGLKEFPKDWDNFVKLCKAVATDKRIPLILGPDAYYFQAAFLPQRGAKLFNDNYTEAYFNSPEVVEALADEAYLIKNKLATVTIADPIAAFKSDQACMYVQGPWYKNQLKNNIPELKGQFRFAAMPVKKAGGAATALTGLGMAIPFNAENIPEAVAFIKYFSGDVAAQKAYFGDVGSPSPLKALLNDKMYNVVDEYLGVSMYPALVESMKNGVAIQIFPKAELNQAIADAMDAAFNTDMSAKEALDAAQAKAEKLLK